MVMVMMCCLSFLLILLIFSRMYVNLLLPSFLSCLSLKCQKKNERTKNDSRTKKKKSEKVVVVVVSNFLFAADTKK